MSCHFYNNQNQKERRRELRRNQTETEKILWQELRGRKFKNSKFYRQYSIGPYILDFFCPQIRLAIEVDGEQHKENMIYDEERDNFLKDKDITTIRFWNEEILNDLEKVLERIKNNPLSPPYNKEEIRENPSLVVREGRLRWPSERGEL